MKQSSKNRILLVAIVALTIIIGVMTFAVIVSNKKINKKNDGSTSINIDSTTTEDNEGSSQEEMEVTTEKETESKKDADIFATITCNNSWESEGKISGQFDLSISNKTKEDKNNWKIEINVSKDIKLENVWNANLDVDDGKITITPVDYNNTLTANSTLKDIGFILVLPSDKDIEMVSKNIKLYINDEEYIAENVTEAETEVEDTAATTQQPDSNTTEAGSDIGNSAGKPFAEHGKLSVKGVDLCDEHGNPYQLKGISTHGIAWFPDYVNEDALKTLRDDWGANLFRIAMYTDESGGYCSGGNKDNLKALVDKGVTAATNLDMYVIIDWHILHDLSPKVYEDEAKAFFEEMSSKYKDYDNVIYEICNEPNGNTTWSDVKSYAEEIIPIIKANNEDAVIIVGTPTWSQDVDIAAKDPIKGYDNIMYALHFYAATHTDGIRNKVTTARDAGIPVFISEFSICDASGNGAIDYGQAEKWFDLINDNNLSYAAWSLSNKNETSALIKSSCTKKSGWNEDELSDAGNWIRNKILGD